ncbi:hypothetical protein DFH09DRAFT_1091649 [Mycena vulgaris]|nr:hypothetical protein DFH09DRAFT_1091649 [Mycena vulgaris]
MICDNVARARCRLRSLLLTPREGEEEENVVHGAHLFPVSLNYGKGGGPGFDSQRSNSLSVKEYRDEYFNSDAHTRSPYYYITRVSHARFYYCKRQVKREAWVRSATSEAGVQRRPNIPQRAIFYRFQPDDSPALASYSSIPYAESLGFVTSFLCTATTPPPDCKGGCPIAQITTRGPSSSIPRLILPSGSRFVFKFSLRRQPHPQCSMPPLRSAGGMLTDILSGLTMPPTTLDFMVALRSIAGGSGDHNDVWEQNWRSPPGFRTVVKYYRSIDSWGLQIYSSINGSEEGRISDIVHGAPSPGGDLLNRAWCYKEEREP